LLKPGQVVTGEDLKEFCYDRLARYKIPKRVEFLDELPYSPYGKVIKAKLREMFID